MRLLINTASTFKGGGIQVAKSFIEECARIENTNKYLVILGENLAKLIDTSSFNENFDFIQAPFRPATLFFSLKSHNKFLKEAQEAFNPDVVFTTSGPAYWRPKVPHLMGYNIPHYVYPESPYFDIISLKKRLWWLSMRIFGHYQFKNNADAYVVQTDDVRQRLKKFIKKEKIYTVFNTINSHYLAAKETPLKLPEKKNNEYRLLTLSAWYPHKNLVIIKKVIDVLRAKQMSNITFIITIDDESFERHEFGVYDEIVNLGKVKIEEAPSLYKECDAMFLPTLLECFSASYAEAMQMERPILTSDMGFAHTICDDAALYFDPMDPSDVAEKIISLVQSIELRKELTNKGSERLKLFGTPKDRALKYLDICNALIQS